MAARKQANTYVDLLMQEWRLGEASRIVQACVRQVLEELDGTAQLSLRREPRLEVMVLPESGHSVWAYFPVHRGRTIARKCKPKSATRVLLVLSDD
jgi:hypothetical protein